MTRLAAAKVSLQGSHVLVLNSSVPSVEFANAVLAEVDRLLVEGAVGAVLFDTRRTEAPSREVGETLWAWLERAEHHRRVAIVVTSEMLRVSANMTALSKRTSVRSFPDIDQAVAWLKTEPG